MQRVAVCCIVLQYIDDVPVARQTGTADKIVLQCDAGCCSVLHFVAVYCIVLRVRGSCSRHTLKLQVDSHADVETYPYISRRTHLESCSSRFLDKWIETYS